MRQTLHIFRKDVRFLWAPILLVLALTAAAAWLRMAEPAGMARGSAVPASPATAATYFLTMSWWYLVLAAIHKERPTGNRQFWVTRPYGWRSLLGAKLLLVIAFINLPYLISDVAILHANGLVPSVMSLLARQVAITGVLLLPVAALATVTRNAAETVLAVLGVLVAALYAALHGSGPAQLWGALEWMHVWAAVGRGVRRDARLAICMAPHAGGVGNSGGGCRDLLRILGGAARRRRGLAGDDWAGTGGSPAGSS